MKWVKDSSLESECSYTNNILALYLKTKGDFILVSCCFLLHFFFNPRVTKMVIVIVPCTVVTCELSDAGVWHSPGKPRLLSYFNFSTLSSLSHLWLNAMRLLIDFESQRNLLKLKQLLWNSATCFCYLQMSIACVLYLQEKTPRHSLRMA